jgi:hypothetical protein
MFPLPSQPFKTAERYIQLRKICAPISWADSITRMNDMILMPIISFFLLFIRAEDLITAAFTMIKTYQVWAEFTEYTQLRFDVQRMFLYSQSVGGPFIVTNDPIYMPYVFADAVYRVPVGISKSPPGGKLEG